MNNILNILKSPSDHIIFLKTLQHLWSQRKMLKEYKTTEPDSPPLLWLHLSLFTCQSTPATGPPFCFSNTMLPPQGFCTCFPLSPGCQTPHTSLLRSILECVFSVRPPLTTCTSCLCLYLLFLFRLSLIHNMLFLFVVCLLPLGFKLHKSKDFSLLFHSCMFHALAQC